MALRSWLVLGALILTNLPATSRAAQPAKPESNKQPSLRILFLGDNGHHRPAERFRQLQPILERRGIDLTYTDKVEALDPKVLGKYDGLIIYANIEKIAPDQEKALLDFVASGKGFIPIHCASYCFLNSPKYVRLVGAQFQKHGNGTFRTVSAGVKHPITKGFQEFESWDETYFHATHHDIGRIVLAYREDENGKEPWTWIINYGRGRVFYTAWGHDERTWGHPGFHNLIERGIRWAVGADVGVVPDYIDQPEMTKLPKDLKPFEYVEANVPYYPAGKSWGTIDKKKMMMQLPLSPEESMKHMVTPVGFEVKLFAAEPNIRRPICMNWDERGRLWIAETVDYPNNRQKDGEGNDRLVICEDTDGDGVADKFTVFADKLSIPTGFTFAHGGVIVFQAPHTLFLRDSTGGDKADERKILFTGWGTGDTHAGPSNLQYGLDNWIYGTVGYSGFNGTVAGEKHKFGQGFFRFQCSPHAPRGDGQPGTPQVTKLEFLRSTNNNTWGLGFSEEGHLFGSTANGNPSVHMPIANRYYEMVRGWSAPVAPSMAGNAKMHPITDRVRQVDWHGHFTAAAGHALYTARLYPKEYWNRTAFVCEPTGHLVAVFQIEPDGSGFKSRNAWNLLASDDEWTSPIMAEVGPDGCVWVIDWYNYIVQHNPTPAGFKTGKGNAYETDLRDKKHGRIYRIVPKNAKLPPPLDLKKATAKELVATLKNDNMFWRKHAQRMLVERGKTDVLDDLSVIASDKAIDEPGLNVPAIHGLWVLAGLDPTALTSKKVDSTLAKALDHQAPGVRRNALLLLPGTKKGASIWASSAMVRETDPHVRLASLLTLSHLPLDSPDSGGLPVDDAVIQKLILEISDQSRKQASADPWLSEALIVAAARHDYEFLVLSLYQVRKISEKRTLNVVRTVAEHLARRGPDEASIEAKGMLIGWMAADVEKTDRAITEAILDGFASGWPGNGKQPLLDDTTEGLLKLLPTLSPKAQSQLIQLANTWGSKAFEKQAAEIAKSLLGIVGDNKQSDDDRIAAARQILEMKASGGEMIGQLLNQITPRTGPKLAAGIIDALGSSASSAVGPALVKNLAGLTPAAKTAALRVLLSRRESTRAFLDAVDKGQAQLSDLSLDQKQSLAAHPDARIADRAKKFLAAGGGLPSADRQKIIDELLPLMKNTGDVALGKAMHKKHCAICHIHGNEGTRIGPDLTGMAAHPKSELLIHIIDPSRSVEGNYRNYTVSLEDGRVLHGLMASESRTAIELIDSEAKKHIIQRDNIDKLTATTKSLMPDGFEKQMNESEIVGLLEFLTQRGKFLPLDLSKVASAVSTRGMFYSNDAEVERLILPDWSPREVKGVPFHFVDPMGERNPNVILFYGPEGTIPPKMPKSVKLPVNGPAKAIHFLSGVSGWGYPYANKGSVTLIVRLHYQDGKTEDHPLKNGEHFADYIRRVDVPGSEFAFAMRGQQMRYLAIHPKREESITEIELAKGNDRTAPVVLAVTVEGK